MVDDVEHLTLSESAARQLANSTKTRAQWRGITPRWLINFLSWTPVEAGIFRLNQVRQEGEPTDVEASAPRDASPDLPETYVDYVHDPRELFLKAVTTVLDVQTRVSDLYSHPFDQVQEQLRLLIEGVKEKQEGELVNNSDYGLLSNVASTQRISTRKGPPTPDDIDELLTKVWKEPSFFLAHPRSIAAFGRECTRRGVPPATITLFGTPFVTWRGVPLVPSDKIKIEGGNGAQTSKILLIRTGEKKQGVVGLFQPGVPGEVSPSLSVRFMGINRKAIASYLISLYSSLAVLTDDALAVLDDVEVGRYPEYTHAYA
ncbi:MAG TPA: family 2A encapsulin nanocompartment shell protein [Roseiarcus sp.]|nr:family 2A encapsulin nanocompartment shell protein [Roseiarcus sp.]